MGFTLAVATVFKLLGRYNPCGQTLLLIVTDTNLSKTVVYASSIVVVVLVAIVV